MTKFKTITKEINNPTYFKEGISNEGKMFPCSDKPNDYEEVIWVGFDRFLGDVFICIYKDIPDRVTIRFGKKGDEFNQ